MMMRVQLTKYTSRCSTSLSTKPLVVRVWDSRLWEVPIVLEEPWASSSGDLLDRWHRHHQRVYCQHQPPPSLQNGLSWRSSSLGAASWDQRRLQGEGLAGWQGEGWQEEGWQGGGGGQHQRRGGQDPGLIHPSSLSVLFYLSNSFPSFPLSLSSPSRDHQNVTPQFKEYLLPLSHSPTCFLAIKSCHMKKNHNSQWPCSEQP